MSPPSKKEALLEGALTCLQEQGYADTRARDIAEASGANLASIGYHYGSTEGLLGAALAEGFRRWMVELALQLGPAMSGPPALRVRRVASGMRSSIEAHRGLALADLEAMARAPRSEELRRQLADSYAEAGVAVAALLGLGDDEAGRDTAALLIATVDGLIIRMLVDPERAPTDEALERAAVRLGELVSALSPDRASAR